MKRLLLVALAAVALAAAGIFYWRTRKPPLANGWAFCGVRGRNAKVAGSSVTESMFSAAALSLTDHERAELEAALRDANARWEAQVNPLLEDLGEGDPDDDLRRWLQKGPTPVVVALAASTPLFCGGDGFCVAPVEEATECAPGFDRLTAKADIDRARFLAWPFGYALWLRADSPDAAKNAVAALRDHVRQSRFMGLVLHADDTRRASEPPLDGLRERYGEHQALSRAAKEGPAAHREEPGRLDLDPRDVMVLPRLEAMTSRQAFEDEVRAAAPALHILR